MLAEVDGQAALVRKASRVVVVADHRQRVGRVTLATPCTHRGGPNRHHRRRGSAHPRGIRRRGVEVLVAGRSTRTKSEDPPRSASGRQVSRRSPRGNRTWERIGSAQNAGERQRRRLSAVLRPYLYILPTFFFLFVFTHWPILRTFYVSLFKWNLATPKMEFVGFGQLRAGLERPGVLGGVCGIISCLPRGPCRSRSVWRSCWRCSSTRRSGAWPFIGCFCSIRR